MQCTIEEARLRAELKAPYFGEILFNMRMIESTKVPTMGVDKYWNCYWNPEMVATWTMDEIAFVLVHEAFHCWLNHVERGEAWTGGRKELFVVHNYGADAAINPTIRDMKLTAPFKGKDGKEGCIFPENYSFPANLTAEQYADLFLNSDKVKFVTIQYGGSCSDGDLRDWEEGGERPELDKVTREIVSREVAERISKRAGDLPGGLKSMAAAILAPPVVRWQDELRAQMRCAIEWVRGHKDWTFMRPRRSGKLILPGAVAPVPRSALLLDTSGSMGSPDTQGRVLNEVNHVLKAYQRAMRVVVGDTCIHGEKVCTSAGQVEWIGNGGTDMASIVETIASRRGAQAADIIILITDGYTPWPRPIRQKLIAVITPGGEASAPGWVRQVVMR